MKRGSPWSVRRKQEMLREISQNSGLYGKGGKDKVDVICFPELSITGYNKIKGYLTPKLFRDPVLTISAV